MSEKYDPPEVTSSEKNNDSAISESWSELMQFWAKDEDENKKREKEKYIDTRPRIKIGESKKGGSLYITESWNKLVTGNTRENYHQRKSKSD